MFCLYYMYSRSDARPPTPPRASAAQKPAAAQSISKHKNIIRMSGRGRGGRGGRGGRTNERRGQRSMNDIVTKKPKYHRYQNADVLLTDDIHPNGAPHEAQGKLFQ